MSYQITIQPSGHQFELAEDEYVLDGALKHGIMFPYGCRGGSCGTCFGKVISGDIDYPEGLPMGLMESDHASGQALFCVAKARSDLTIDVREIRSRDEIRVKTLPAQVISVKKLAPDVMELRLALPASERLMFRAGQYLDFLLRNRKRRAFSIANAPVNDEFLELHIRLVPGGEFTQMVFDIFQLKTLVRLEAPLGDFYVREESNRPIIMIAGGTGFAPIKSMIEQLQAEEDTRPIHLYWGARAKVDLYLHALAQRWAQGERFDYTPVLSQAAEEDDWQGQQGYVHEVVAKDYPDLSGFDVYMAGPPQMIVAATQRFRAQGLPQMQLFADAFEYSNDG
ncbi:CDP-6-deoxy-delta-3,4-glucoseen reductase [Leucothrix pacifica]|uniref:CDP-6-deoxy-delta-3,4-glucoseen reductase n=1 Tax=Leucothrix pacifica TaxID=1247513 RepID=A0A317CEX4_9GAMM|nr:CDP-6-deoxy-delta-3,4-glucoseen reductase [Leucothrix pacifica]PWQ96899.1 CDP-6-deoxy-delta-3,4-glucoseen reductase [Leucothrix pacifica]